MKKSVISFLLICGLSAGAQDAFQLAPPILDYHSGFFADTTSLSLRFNQPGTEVRYTVNGKDPGAKDPVYRKPIRIDKNGVFKARAFGKGYLPSETVSASFFKSGKKIQSVTFTRPNEYYAKAKENILHDNAGGQTNYRTGTWLGYDGDSVELTITLAKKEKVNTVYVNVLADEPSWIFLPEQILVHYFDEKQQSFLPAGKEVIMHDSASPKSCSLRAIHLRQPEVTDKLMIKLFVVKSIPAWHASGKGKHAWLFIDEVNVY